jgi:hypothetical protein
MSSCRRGESGFDLNGESEFEQLQGDQTQTIERLEGLVAFSTERQSLIDWDILERVDVLAWD